MRFERACQLKKLKFQQGLSLRAQPSVDLRRAQSMRNSRRDLPGKRLRGNSNLTQAQWLDHDVGKISDAVDGLREGCPTSTLLAT